MKVEKNLDGDMRKMYIIRCICLWMILGLMACSGPVRIQKNLEVKPEIFPDYVDVTIPPNIAPLNFALNDQDAGSCAVFSFGGQQFEVKGEKGGFVIPPSKWKKLLESAAGNSIQVTVQVKQGNEWVAYSPFTIQVAAEKIDSYLAYRLIDPGYELWNKMGIYQRDLESYTQTPIIENKMSAERAEQLFGEDWIDIIEHSTTAIQDKFYERMLIYKNGFRRTEKGSITLGWKFELLNKSGGDLSGKMLLTDEQVVDVYAGSNLSPDKKNASVCGQIIRDSGVANYILMDENVHSAQDVIDKMIPIREYVMMHPDIYFACKALNYRTFAEKWDGNRPLSVQVNWDAINNRLVPELVFDKPLIVKGDEVAERLIHYMRKLNIRTTEDIDEDNSGTDKIV